MSSDQPYDTFTESPLMPFSAAEEEEEDDEEMSQYSRSNTETTLEISPESSDSHYSPPSSAADGDADADTDADADADADTDDAAAESDGEPKAKVAKIDDGDNDSGLNCPICFDPWNNSGEHRLVSLKCGHLFGNSCIAKWIRQQKVCPTCKARSMLKDIRQIYARHVGCVDNSEVEALRREMEKDREEMRRKELEIQKLAQAQVVYVEKIQELTGVIETYMNPVLSRTNKWKLTLESNMTVSKEHGCRVFTYDKNTNSLVYSLPKLNTVFSGYTVRQMYMDTQTLGGLIFAHSREIRCMEYSNWKRLLMTASLDKNVGLINLNEGKKIMSIPTVGPLWSCCWDSENVNRLFAGTSTGRMVQFDIRQPKSSLFEMPADSDLSPVISIRSVPGGIISCQLNSLKAHKLHPFLTSSFLQSGPFMDMNFHTDINRVVVSTRANFQNVRCKHLLYDVDMREELADCLSIVCEYNGSAKQTFMTKVSQFKYGTQNYLAAFNESDRAVQVWNTSRHSEGPCIQTSDGIVDICPWTYNNESFLSTLSQKKIRTYKIVEEVY